MHLKPYQLYVHAYELWPPYTESYIVIHKIISAIWFNNFYNINYKIMIYH
jgi:hypothetical protein